MSRFTNKIVLVTAALLASCTLLTFAGHSVSALSAGDWNSGKIISDDLFFKSESMSTQDIQNFLNSMMPSCDTNGTKIYGGGQTRAQYGASRGYPAPYTCLKDYVENPTTHQNNANGGSVSGGITAAQIIKSAADTYNISPKVLIVLLQKEQSLISDDWPWTIQYRSATGYGCPDTAPCDSEYYGFYNQVTKAAYQFKRYAQYGSEYRYKAFQSNFIQWSPNAACGGSDVYISSQATAGLYNYTPYQPNTAALNNLYGSGDGCSAYGNRNFWRMYNDWFGSTQYEEIFLNSQPHISGLGWVNPTPNSGMIGTTGRGIPLEAFKINGSVEYSSYNNTTGWQPTLSDGMVSGVTGLSRPIHAIKINPLGALADKYDLYYRVHTSTVGWMGWAKNGQPAGVSGDSTKNIEAIEIRLVIKGYAINGSTTGAFDNISTTTYNPSLSVNVDTHVQNVGWQPYVLNDMTSGTMNQSLRIEALKLSLNNSTGLSGDIIYSTHVQNVGWQPYFTNNSIAGTVGQGLRAEAVRIALTGQLGDNYDIWYSAYIQNYGWLDWAKNGQAVGSLGPGLRMEALVVRIAPKGTLALPNNNYLHNPGNTPVSDTFSFSYSAHVSNIGWMSNFTQEQTGGTTGQGRAMEALRFDSTSSIFGSLGINCSAYNKSVGWVENVTNNNTCGVVGLAKPMEAVKLQLTGTAASKYNIYYKVHLSTLGWQEWTQNGTQAGTPNSGKNIEAIIVKLVQK